MTTKVLVVDDSESMCRFLSQIINGADDLEVIGYALDAYEARSMIKAHNPDVLTLDIEMPRMDGITFLKNLMRLRPMPVVMASSLTAPGAEVTLEALRIGAVDFVVKRQPGSGSEYQQYLNEIISKVRAAARAKVRCYDESAQSAGAGASGRVRRDLPEFQHLRQRAQKIEPPSADLRALIAVGASTGGPEAVRLLLRSLFAPNVAVLVSQHMPARFMQPFSARLDRETPFTVCEAQEGAVLRGGHCYVAPGDAHLGLTGRAPNLRLTLDGSAPCQGHRPSVDVMYQHLATRAAPSTIGILLTGMGQDGAEGMKALQQAGALNIVQDERSSAVWGMPGTAVKLGAVHAQLSLEDIGPTVLALLEAG